MLVAPSHGSASLNNSGLELLYTPTPNYNGLDLIELHFCDKSLPAFCANVTMNITVLPMPDTPIAKNNGTTNHTINEDQVLIVRLIDLVESVDTEVSAVESSIVGAPSHGHASISIASTSVVYTPSLDYHGTDSFIVEICSSGPNKICANVTFSLTVLSIEDAPRRVETTFNGVEDTPFTIPLSNCAYDPESNIDKNSVSIISLPTIGSVSYDNTGSGSFTYTPHADKNGDDYFVVRVCDTTLLCGNVNVTVRLSSVPDAPRLTGLRSQITVVVAHGEKATIHVPNEIFDPDNVGLNLTSTIVKQNVSNGGLTLTKHPSGSHFDYTPNKGYSGNDTFVFTICDLDEQCSDIGVTVTVLAQVTPPNVVNPTVPPGPAECSFTDCVLPHVIVWPLLLIIGIVALLFVLKRRKKEDDEEGKPLVEVKVDDPSSEPDPLHGEEAVAALDEEILDLEENRVDIVEGNYEEEERAALLLDAAEARFVVELARLDAWKQMVLDGDYTLEEKAMLLQAHGDAVSKLKAWIQAVRDGEPLEETEEMFAEFEVAKHEAEIARLIAWKASILDGDFTEEEMDTLLADYEDKRYEAESSRLEAWKLSVIKGDYTPEETHELLRMHAAAVKKLEAWRSAILTPGIAEDERDRLLVEYEECRRDAELRRLEIWKNAIDEGDYDEEERRELLAEHAAAVKKLETEINDAAVYAERTRQAYIRMGQAAIMAAVEANDSENEEEEEMRPMVNEIEELEEKRKRIISGEYSEDEKNRLLAELDANMRNLYGKFETERERQRLRLEARLNARRKKLEQKKNDILSGDYSEEERMRLLAEHAAAMKKLEEGFDSERERQAQSLAARLAERRRRKEQGLGGDGDGDGEQEYDANGNPISQKPNRIGSLGSLDTPGEDTPDWAMDAVDSGLSAEAVAAIVAAQKEEEEKNAREAELEQQLEEEKRVLEEQLAAEEAEAQMILEEETKMMEAARIEAEKERMERKKRAILEGGYSDEEKNRLLAEHATAMKKLEDGFESEREKQKRRLAARLEDRRRRKEGDLVTQHTTRKKKKALEFRETMEQQRIEEQVAEEKSALEKAMENATDPARRRYLIELIMQNRHGQELQQLSMKQLEETDIVIEEKLNRLKAAQAEAVHALGHQQQADMNDELMEADEASISIEERSALISEIEARQDEELKALDVKQKHESDTLQQVALKEIEEKQREESQQLRRRQFDELVEAAKKYAPEEVAVLEAQFEEAQAAMVKDVENAKHKLEDETAAELERLKQEQIKFAEDEKAKMENELATLREKMDKEAEKERMTSQARRADARAKMKEQLQKRLQDDLESLDDLKQEEKDALLKENQSAYERQLEQQEQERARQDRILEEKIQAKRQRALERAAKRAERAGREAEKIAQADAQEVVEREARKLEQAMEAPVLPSAPIRAKLSKIAQRARARRRKSDVSEYSFSDSSAMTSSSFFTSSSAMTDTHSHSHVENVEKGEGGGVKPEPVEEYVAEPGLPASITPGADADAGVEEKLEKPVKEVKEVSESVIPKPVEDFVAAVEEKVKPMSADSEKEATVQAAAVAAAAAPTVDLPAVAPRPRSSSESSAASKKSKASSISSSMTRSSSVVSSAAGSSVTHSHSTASSSLSRTGSSSVSSSMSGSSRSTSATATATDSKSSVLSASSSASLSSSSSAVSESSASVSSVSASESSANDLSVKDEASVSLVDDNALEKKRLEEEAAEKKRLEEEAAEKKRLEEEEAEKKRLEEEEAEKKRLEEEAEEKKRLEEEAEKKRMEDAAQFAAETQAAVVIQCSVRRKQAKSLLEAKREDLKRRNDAATKIQSIARGRAGRVVAQTKWKEWEVERAAEEAVLRRELDEMTEKAKAVEAEQGAAVSGLRDRIEVASADREAWRVSMEQGVTESSGTACELETILASKREEAEAVRQKLQNLEDSVKKEQEQGDTSAKEIDGEISNVQAEGEAALQAHSSAVASLEKALKKAQGHADAQDQSVEKLQANLAKIEEKVRQKQTASTQKVEELSAAISELQSTTDAKLADLQTEIDAAVSKGDADQAAADASKEECEKLKAVISDANAMKSRAEQLEGEKTSMQNQLVVLRETLKDEAFQKIKYSNLVGDLVGNIRVSCRVGSEAAASGQYTVTCKEKEYVFDSVSTPSTSPSDVFEAAYEPMVQHAVDGFNSVVVAAGSGPHDLFGDNGMVALAVSKLFKLVGSGASESDNDVTCSVVELDGAFLTDLLQSDGDGGDDLSFGIDGRIMAMTVRNAINKKVTNAADTIQLIDEAISRRSEDTHAIVSFNVKTKVKIGRWATGRLALFDMVDEDDSIDAISSVFARLLENELLSCGEHPVTTMLMDFLGGVSKGALVISLPSSEEEEEMNTLLDLGQTAKVKNIPMKFLDNDLIRNVSRCIAEIEASLGHDELGVEKLEHLYGLVRKEMNRM